MSDIQYALGDPQGTEDNGTRNQNTIAGTRDHGDPMHADAMVKVFFRKWEEWAVCREGPAHTGTMTAVIRTGKRGAGVATSAR